MEFFRSADLPLASQEKLLEAATISNLPKICKSIDKALRDDGGNGLIYCVWGEFEVNRELLKHGVRFSLPTCPNALQFTITIDNNGCVVIHCTINKLTHEIDFINSIDKFMDDLHAGLIKYFKEFDHTLPD